MTQLEMFPIPTSDSEKGQPMKVYTKESLIESLKEIRAMGWIKSGRPGNAGAVGNTLEDLLGIEENNLPIPNAAEWELKAQRGKSGSLTTGLHIEPSPTAFKFVSKILLPKYGWPHKEAGKKYPAGEMSFRQTINCCNRTDRGFGISVNREKRRIEVSFDYTQVNPRHSEWLESVRRRVDLGELNPQPYWGFDDIFHAVGIKLKNCFYIKAQSKIENGIEYFFYDRIMVLMSLNQDRLIETFENGTMLIDFDARTHHNHGTKIRSRKDVLPLLYTEVITV